MQDNICREFARKHTCEHQTLMGSGSVTFLLLLLDADHVFLLEEMVWQTVL